MPGILIMSIRSYLANLAKKSLRFAQVESPVPPLGKAKRREVAPQPEPQQLQPQAPQPVQQPQQPQQVQPQMVEQAPQVSPLQQQQQEQVVPGFDNTQLKIMSEKTGIDEDLLRETIPQMHNWVVQNHDNEMVAAPSSWSSHPMYQYVLSVVAENALGKQFSEPWLKKVLYREDLSVNPSFGANITYEEAKSMDRWVKQNAENMGAQVPPEWFHDDGKRAYLAQIATSIMGEPRANEWLLNIFSGLTQQEQAPEAPEEGEKQKSYTDLASSPTVQTFFENNFEEFTKMTRALQGKNRNLDSHKIEEVAADGAFKALAGPMEGHADQRLSFFYQFPGHLVNNKRAMSLLAQNGINNVEDVRNFDKQEVMGLFSQVAEDSAEGPGLISLFDSLVDTQHSDVNKHVYVNMKWAVDALRRDNAIEKRKSGFGLGHEIAELEYQVEQLKNMPGSEDEVEKLEKKIKRLRNKEVQPGTVSMPTSDDEGRAADYISEDMQRDMAGQTGYGYNFEDQYEGLVKNKLSEYFNDMENMTNVIYSGLNKERNEVEEKIAQGKPVSSRDQTAFKLSMVLGVYFQSALDALDNAITKDHEMTAKKAKKQGLTTGWKSGRVEFGFRGEDQPPHFKVSPGSMESEMKDTAVKKENVEKLTDEFAKSHPEFKGRDEEYHEALVEHIENETGYPQEFIRDTINEYKFFSQYPAIETVPVLGKDGKQLEDENGKKLKHKKEFRSPSEYFKEVTPSSIVNNNKHRWTKIHEILFDVPDDYKDPKTGAVRDEFVDPETGLVRDDLYLYNQIPLDVRRTFVKLFPPHPNISKGAWNPKKPQGNWAWATNPPHVEKFLMIQGKTWDDVEAAANEALAAGKDPKKDPNIVLWNNKLKRDKDIGKRAMAMNRFELYGAYQRADRMLTKLQSYRNKMNKLGSNVSGDMLLPYIKQKKDILLELKFEDPYAN